MPTTLRRTAIAHALAAAVCLAPAPGAASQHDPGAADRDCLARAIYFEARGLPERSREAVAHVVLNRVGVRARTVCGVVHERVGGRPQFDFMRRPRPPTDQRQWAEARRIADRMLAAERPADFTRGATHFYNPRLARPRTPQWARPDRVRWADGHHVFVEVPMAPARGVRVASVQPSR